MKIVAVYFLCEYNYDDAVEFLKSCNLNADHGYMFNKFLIFYQKEKYVPNLYVDDFYRVVGEDVMWENMPGSSEGSSGLKYDYKYSVVTTNVMLVSCSTIT